MGTQNGQKRFTLVGKNISRENILLVGQHKLEEVDFQNHIKIFSSWQIDINFHDKATTALIEMNRDNGHGS